MMTRASRQSAVAAVVLLVLSGCASRTHSATVTMPSPSAGDTEGQIMSVTGSGFTMCGISDDGPDHYDVTVCGDMSQAKSALLKTPYGGICAVHAYQADDGGSHTPQELVVQWWVGRTRGSGFTVTSTQITNDGMIDVGVDGDLKAARAVLDREFPDWTEVHGQVGLPAV